MSWKNECKIEFDGGKNFYLFGFDEYHNGNSYIVIDKQLIGEYVGKQIMGENKKFDFDKDYVDIYEKIDEILINKIVDEIYGCVEDYLRENYEE